MFGMTSLSYPHSVQQHFPLYRAVPVPVYCYFHRATPGGIWAAFPTALHPPAALWRKRERLLIPINVFLLRCDNPNKSYGFCQALSGKNRGTLPYFTLYFSKIRLYRQISQPIPAVPAAISSATDSHCNAGNRIPSKYKTPVTNHGREYSFHIFPFSRL